MAFLPTPARTHKFGQAEVMSGLMFPKGVPRAITKATKRREARADLEQAYADVDLRDGPFCRVTGRYTWAGAPDPRVRREHHHLETRGLAPGRITDPSNIVVVCAEAHGLFKAGALESEGTDANQPVFFHFNRAIVKAGSEPFVIKAKREPAA